LKGYLLDTNHVSALANRNPKIQLKISSLPKETLICTCTITLGEIEFGHLVTTTTDQPKRDSCAAFINSYFLPNVLGVSGATRFYYGQIMSRIWKRHSPSRGSISTDLHLANLGLNINDVWIVAVAWEHGLIMATTDKMERIRESVSEVEWENWL
jgi:predicted nucleic acid-binding protein